MRNRSVTYNNRVFESILDDVNTSNIDVSSLADNGNDSFRQIEYGNYEYEVRIYFTSEVFYYDKLVKEQLPKMHDELSLVLENSRLFSAVSPVRIMAMTAELQMIEQYKDEPIIKYWTDEIDKPWAYYGWSAVFCCNMGPVKNVRRFLNFLGMAFAATYKASSAGRPIISFRKNEFVSILGPSGSGKTTLLNIIGGLDNYTSGDLIINGVSTKKYKDKD